MGIITNRNFSRNHTLFKHRTLLSGHPILTLYGFFGVLIKYSTHNWRYYDFSPCETPIFAILGHFHTFRAQNFINGSPATPLMAYISLITRYTDIIWSFRGSILGFKGAKMARYLNYNRKMSKMAKNGVFMLIWAILVILNDFRSSIWLSLNRNYPKLGLCNYFEWSHVFIRPILTEIWRFYFFADVSIKNCL